ncbi:MAG TPA: hypothetical protein DCY07_06720 [Rhodospirillaceae bacterium]|nr:hypothetical protein [Rhodospirillaceae bacterium]
MTKATDNSDHYSNVYGSRLPVARGDSPSTARHLSDKNDSDLKLMKAYSGTIFGLLTCLQDGDKKPLVTCPSIMNDGRKLSEHAKEIVCNVQIGNLRYHLHGKKYRDLVIQTHPHISNIFEAGAITTISAVEKIKGEFDTLEKLAPFYTPRKTAARVYINLSSIESTRSAVINVFDLLSEIALVQKMTDSSSLPDFQKRVARLAIAARGNVAEYIDTHGAKCRILRMIPRLPHGVVFKL